MKKLLFLILLIMLLFQMTACNGDKMSITSTTDAEKTQNGVQGDRADTVSPTYSEIVNTQPSVPVETPTDGTPIIAPILLSSDQLDAALSKMYEIDTLGYGETDGFNHNNVISNQLIYTQEDQRSSNFTFQSADKKLNLSYQETVFYPVGETKLHKYTIDEEDQGCFYFDENGELSAILNYTIARLDIAPSDTAETVLTALKPAISKYVNPDKYQNLDIARSNPDEADFGFYRFWFYNSVSGCYTDYFTVGVMSDGTVTALSITNAEPDAVALANQINPDVEKELIAAKLTDIYATEKTKPLNYSIYYARIVSFEGNACIEYTIDCNVEYLSHSSSSQCMMNTLLIPLEVLSDSSEVAYEE